MRSVLLKEKMARDRDRDRDRKRDRKQDRDRDGKQDRDRKQYHSRFCGEGPPSGARRLGKPEGGGSTSWSGG